MGHIILSFLFFNYFLFIIYRHYQRGDYYINKKRLIIYTFLLIAFATYGGGEGDYLHYKEIVEQYHTLYDVAFSTGMESQYYYLAYLVNGNYTMWRLVLFSIEFIGMSFFLYKAKLNTYPIFLCFISVCLVESVYGRSFWGLIYFVLGLFLLIEKNNPLYLMAIAFCYVSHTQNIVLLALLPLAFINIKKWHLLIVLILMGTIVSELKSTFTFYLDSGGIEGADYINGRMVTYNEAERGNFGNSFGEFIIFILRYMPIIVIVLIWVKIIFTNRKRYLECYKPYRRLINITLGIVLVSIVLLFASLGSGTIFYRVLGMTLFPVSLLLPYMAENKIIKKTLWNNYMMIYMFIAELGYIKDVYYAYANGISW